MATDTPLDVIENGIYRAEPIANLLRMALLLGGAVGSPRLRSWATAELHGYEGPGRTVPEYRWVSAPLQADAYTGSAVVSGQNIDPSVIQGYLDELGVDNGGDKIDNRLALPQPIAALQEIVESRDTQIRIGPNWGEVAARMIDSRSGNPYQRIDRLYYAVSTTSVRGVIDRITTTLAELIAELRVVTPRDSALPNSTAATAAVTNVLGPVQNLIIGDGGSISTTTTIVQPGDRDGLRAALATAGAEDAETEELVSLLEGLSEVEQDELRNILQNDISDEDSLEEEAEASQSRPRRIRALIRRVGARVAPAAGAVTAGATGNLLSDLVGGFLGFS